MSSKPVTQAQLELLLGTVKDQSSEIEALRRRVTELESRVLALAVASASKPDEFEVVSTVRAPTDPDPSEATTSSLTISSSGISEERREIARGVQWLKRQLWTNRAVSKAGVSRADESSWRTMAEATTSGPSGERAVHKLDPKFLSHLYTVIYYSHIFSQFSIKRLRFCRGEAPFRPFTGPSSSSCGSS